MAIPNEQLIIVDASGKQVELDELMTCYGADDDRVLIDDEIGKVMYIGDLNLYTLKPMADGRFLAQRLTEISRPRFPTRLIRRQIGSVVQSVTADTVFLVRQANNIRKVRAEDLKKGMVLANGEKVFS